MENTLDNEEISECIKDEKIIKHVFYFLRENENDKTIIMKYFVSSEDGLIPQPWFGNINKPSILILGKNPAFKCNGMINDITDSMINHKHSIRDKLIKNLNSQERNEFNSFKWILDTKNTSWLSRWWKNFFGITKVEGTYLEKIIDSIGFFNLYPYYSVDSSHLPNISSKTVEMVNKLFKEKKVKKVIFLWRAAEDCWKAKGLKIPADVEIFYGNNKCPYTISRFDKNLIFEND